MVKLKLHADKGGEGKLLLQDACACYCVSHRMSAGQLRRQKLGLFLLQLLRIQGSGQEQAHPFQLIQFSYSVRKLC